MKQNKMEVNRFLSDFGQNICKGWRVRKTALPSLFLISLTLSAIVFNAGSLQPPVATSTLWLGRDSLSMGRLTVDPAGITEGGPWELSYPIVNMIDPSRCWGIFVGVNTSDPPLPFAWDDATSMSNALEIYPGFDRSRIRMHIGGMSGDYVPPPGYPPYPGNASWTDVKASINWVFNNAAGHDIVVFYFSDHGWRNGTKSIPPGECEGTPPDEPDSNEEGIVFTGADGDEMVSDDTLFSALSIFEFKPTVGLILIFDSCHSEGLTDGTYDLQTLENPHAILTACNRYEVGWWLGSLGHNLYTYYLLDGLKPIKRGWDYPLIMLYTTRADSVTGNNDGITTARELHDYAAARTERYPSLLITQQHPCLKMSETKSRELIVNVYETLMFCPLKNLEPGETPYNCTDIHFYLPLLAAWFPTVTPDGLNWTFPIATGIKFHDWVDRIGVAHVGDTVTAEDVQYSFERMLVQDQRDGPAWIVYYLLTGQHGSDLWDLDYNGFLNDTEASTATLALNGTVTRNDVLGTVTFHLNKTAVMTIGASSVGDCWQQALAQSFTGIVNKEFAVDYGCWPGSWDVNATYNWAHWRRYPSNDYSPLDQEVPEGGPRLSQPPVMCGTGPYCLTSLNKTAPSFQIDKFAQYWQGWPYYENPTSIDTVIVAGTTCWEARKMQFLSGEFDSIDVPSSHFWELMTGELSSFPGIHFVNLTRELGFYFERDWVNGWYYNALCPGIYAYHLYKNSTLVEDVDISVTIAPVTVYPLVQVWKGEMRRGYYEQYPGTYFPARLLYNITVTRKDHNSNVPVLLIAIALKRTNAKGFSTYTNSTLILLAASVGESFSFIRTWYEDGVEECVTADTWKVGAEAHIMNRNAQDTDLTDNYCENGSVRLAELPCDINGDGCVDIFDAIIVSFTFWDAWATGGLGGNSGLYFGMADFNDDGIVDISDAIWLSGHFGNHIP